MDNKLIKGLSITVASLVVMAGSIAIIPSKVSASTDNNKPKLTYCAHVQDYGWDKICKTVGEVSNLSVQSPSINEVVGTEGESRRMEALEINVDAPNGVTVKYRTHVQDYGWMDWITADNKVGTYFAGTTGESRRMEALQIAVEGDIDYEIKYRAHVQDYGWMNWVNACSSINTATLEMGNYVGTVGESRRMEALQIVVVPNKHEEIEASHTHNFTNWTTKVPATCNTHGTEERKCTICGKTETQQTSAFHSLKEYMVDTEYIEPTCTAKGRRCSKCKVCGQIFFDYTADELGHDWATDFTIDKEATCFKDGSKSIHCNREGCTARKDVTVIKALGKHVWRETTIEPTCTEDGKNIIYCENCDKKTETVIEALGHSFKNYVYDGNATCEKDGTETAKCENKNCNEKDTHIKYGTKTGHTLPEGDGVIIKQPSQCAIPGLSKKICMTCGKAIYTEIPGPGHTWKEELKKFTNECTGYTEYRECSKCGMLDVVGRSTKEGGHIWDSEDYVTAKCSVCGMKAPNYTNKWAAENPNSKERIRAVWYVMYKTNLEQSEAFENNKNLDCDSVIDAEVEFDREAPAPKKGFRFIGWYNDGKEVTKNTVLHTTWKDFQKVFEARYERIEN